ncbi:MAG: hypothetical protein AAB480_03510 [Patescibacteria group bacterium]
MSLKADGIIAVARELLRIVRETYDDNDIDPWEHHGDEIFGGFNTKGIAHLKWVLLHGIHRELSHGNLDTAVEQLGGAKYLMWVCRIRSLNELERITPASLMQPA